MISDELYNEISAEWEVGEDGLLRRDASRVVIRDSLGRTYLVLGHDFSDAERRFWFTVGGGRADGEDARDAAVRELAEETGLVVSRQRLIGPVLKRNAMFHFARETRRQTELFFLLDVDDDERDVLSERRNATLTNAERETLDDFGWWYPEELPRLAARGEKVWPERLGALLTSWEHWDGEVTEISEQ